MASNETVALASTAAEPELAKLAGSLSPAAIVQFIIDNPDLWIVTGQISAMAGTVIYAGAHASLKRPPSAAPAKPVPSASLASKKKNKSKANSIGDSPGDSPTDPITRLQERGLQLTDALLIPAIASCSLAGLYYLLKHLHDPSIISRCMRGQVVFSSVASGGILFSAALELGASAVFPSVWTSRDGRRIYRIDADKRQQSWAILSSSESTDTDKPAWTEDATRSTPFPDAVAWFVPTRLVPTAWSLRSLLRKKWPVPLPVALDLIGAEVQCTVLKVAGIGTAMAVSGLYLYSNLSRPGVLNNLMGIAVCFYSLPHFSGTSFLISSVFLLALFLYDMVMVFYTPMMVSVASAIQAPILIAARSGSKRAMMGLGDIVVPGIFICLCLRYDLYRFYASKIQNVETALETETETLVDGEYVRSVSTTASTRKVKAAYVDPQGHWGDRLWTGALSKCSAVAEKLTPGVAASAFPKPFFYMSLASYLLGLFLCNAVVEYTKKGQPALFYLVPLMLLATWGQAAYTGNLKDMWNYTENGSLDTKDVVVDVVNEEDEVWEGSCVDMYTAPSAWEVRAKHLRARERRSKKLRVQKLRAQLRLQREAS